MEISVVIPIYREQDRIPEVHRRVCAVLQDREFELIFVNDASPDESLAVLQALPKVVVVANRFRLGDDRSVLAGLAMAKGRSAIVLRADDQIDAIPSLLKRLSKGDVHCVFARTSGRSVLAAMSGAPSRAGMFFAADRQMIDRLLAYRDHDPFLVPMIGHSELKAVCLREPKTRSWVRWKTAFRALRLIIRLKTR